MADENKPAFYPRVGRNIAKNFRSAQPMPFIDDERAMEIPHEYYDIPTKENRELSRRRGERIADLERQKSADTSPLEKLAGGIQAGRFLGSALTQAINSAPTRLFKGDEAADKFMQERMYKPEQPLAYEYAGDVGNFLEKLETEYKIPPVLPEAVALQFLTAPATSQAARAAGKGAVKAGMALERKMEPVVRGALERGGLPREMVLGMGANTQSNVMKPSGKGANWLDGKRGSVEAQLGKMKMADQTSPEAMAEMQKSIDTAKRIMGDDPTVQRTVNQMENELAVAKRNNAVNSWIDSNLRNYVKNQMATPDDPVRKLAEEGILHMAPYGEQGVVSSRLMNKRMGLGQDPLGMGRNDAARFWERMSDISVDAYPAGSYKHGSLDESLLADNPWLQKVPDETMIYSGKGLSGDLGFDHIIDVLRQDVREGRIRPEQLNKVSMEQAVRRVHEYDQEMARKMAEAQAKVTEGMPIHKDYGDKGFKWIELATPEVATELPSTHIVEPYQSNGVLGQLYRVINPTTGMRGEGFATPERAIKEFNKSHAEEKLADALKYEGDTMGHCVGGYCPDVLEGRSRIFSLRDAKGEPHVTIETAPQNHLDYNSWFNKQPEEIQNKIAQRRLEDKNHDIYEGPEYLAAREALIPRIVQIKGKQNRAPKEDYLPYVQDFVRGGKWSDIGDIQNTGLIRKSDLIDKFSPDELDAIGAGEYLTKGEHDDLLLKALRPPEGMKAGGKVSISNNPDAMMLELNNQKMKNGEPAYAGGKLIVGKGLKAAKPPKIEVPRIAMQFGNDLPLNMNTAEVENLARRFPEPTVDRVNMAHKDVLKRTPELQEAAARIEAGDMSADEYARLVQRYKPVTPYESVPAPASREEILAALSKTSREAEGLPRKETYFGKPSSTLKEGDPVGLRLDIPSYNQANTWVVTAHGPRKSPVSGGAGTRIGYEPVAMATDVDFSVSPKAALGIAKGAEKNTIATMEGKWKPTSSDEAFTLAKQYLKNPEWRQVGMDPERHSFFYDRETMAPVVNAEEVIQIGPLVLAKNPKYGKVEDFKYAKGGLTGAINLGLKAAKPAVSDAERALPLVLPRAMPKSKAEINAHAERVARQMMGEHVTSGKAGDTKNLAGRSLKESQRVKNLEYEFVPTKDVPESQPIQSQIGDINVALPGDFTVSDVELKSLMGEPINSRQEGGSRYGLGHLEDELPLFYASNEGPAQMVQNKVSDLYSLYQPERVMGQHMAMGPIATNFAQHFADANLKYTDYSKLRGADMDMFDQIMSQGYEIKKKNKKTGEVTVKIVDFPNWPGIADPQAAYEAMKRNPEMRKFYNRIMQTPSITEPLGFPSGQDVRYAITSPDLRDMEVNLVGHGVGELVPNVDLTDTANHNTYTKGIRGIYKGHQDVLSPFAIAYPDATQHIITHQRPQDFTGTIQKVFPHQRVDQQFIDEMEQYRRRIKELTGKKEGGAIKKPAAYIDGSEFWEAAKKYGIRDSMENLNKIVDLVNKGFTVDDAARQVADTGMHKAAGGAITGDDLIIEERPL
jgi:hypothetical protein